MDERLDQLRAELVELCDKAEGIMATADEEKRDLSEDELKETETLEGQVKAKRAQCKARERVMFMRTPIGGTGGVAPVVPDSQDLGDPATGIIKTAAIPATVRRVRNMKVFRDMPGESYPLNANERAYRFGKYCQSLMGSRSARSWCEAHGLELRLHQEDVNTTGGYLVPEEFSNDIIRLVEERGIFRQHAKIVPMFSDTKLTDRRTGGLTAHLVGEGAAGTESTMTWDQVRLVAKKWMVLTRITSELNEDAAISVGDQIATEIAFAFASKEDDLGFNGTGISTDGGINGLKPAMAEATAGVITSGSGNNLWSELELIDFTSMIGLLPQFADTPETAWFCHRAFWAQVMEGLAFAAGGNTKGDLAGPLSKSFLGYPVVISQVLPSAEADSTIAVYLGDLSLAAMFGDRRGMTVGMSDQASVGGESVFERDQVALKATERFDIVIHDVGDTSVVGAMVALSTNAA